MQKHTILKEKDIVDLTWKLTNDGVSLTLSDAGDNLWSNSDLV